MTNDSPTGNSPLIPPEEARPSQVDITGPSPLDEFRAASDTMDHRTEEVSGSSQRPPGGAARRKLPSQGKGPVKKILLYLILAVAVYSLAAFFLGPYLLTTTLPTFLAEKLNRPVTIGSARVNPYTLNITLKNGIIGPDLADPEDKIDPVFSFGRLEGKINPAFFLKKGRLLKAIRGTSVFIHLSRQKDGSFNINNLLGSLSTSTKTYSLLHLADFMQAGDINLRNSRLIFTDQDSDSQHSLEEIRLSLPKRDDKSTSISPHFSAVIDGSPISVGGQSESSAEGQNTRLTFTLERVNLADYLAYLPRPFPGLITKGEADMQLLVDYRVSSDKAYHFEISGSGIARDIWLHTPKKGENKIASANFVLRFEPLSSQLTISKLILDQPEIQLQRRQDGTYTFPGAEQEKDGLPGTPIKLETLVVKNGRLSYIDQMVKGGFGAVFNDINLSIDRADDNDSRHAYALNCVTSRKTRIASQGKLSIGTATVDGLVVLHNIPVTALNSYLPSERGITFSSGLVDKAEATLRLTFDGQKKASASLRKIKGFASNLDIYSQGKEWLHIDQTLFSDMILASATSQIFLGNVTMSGLLGHFSPQNTPFVTSLFSPDKQTYPAPFAKLKIKNGTLLLDDFSFQNKPELAIKILEFSAADFGPKGDRPGKIQASLTLPAKGSCQFKGDLSLTPLTGALQLTLSHIPLNIFSAKALDLFRPEIHAGSLDFNGTVSLPDLAFDGRASLNDFQAKKESSQDKLITLHKASTSQIHVAPMPFALQINSLELEGLKVFAALSEEVDSIASLFLNPEKAGDMALGNITVKELHLKDSALHFSDKTLNPPFSKSLTDIQGSLTGLANTPENSLGMDISGTTDDQAILKTKGSVNLFTKNFGADFQVSLHNQPLEPFTPYLEPMVGYSLSGGIFDFSVVYKESEGKVNADSVLTLRHFTLGDHDLGNKQFPVSVALVTDPQHIISLNIAVVGDMTDPSYTFHRAYGKKLRSLISKASVSPFSLLTDFYNPEQLVPDHVLFEPGTSRPAAEFQPHLLAIKDILSARPLLTLTVKGYSAGTEDRDALLQKKRQEEEKKRLALQRSLSTDVVDSYGQEEIIIPSPLAPGDATVILTVSKEELLALAKERCLRVKEILVSQYGVDADRIIISTETTVVPATGAGLAGNRADFILGRINHEAK